MSSTSSDPDRSGPGAEPPRAGALRILVVDDQALNCELTRISLAGRGHSVAIAGNGAEALSILKDQAFDLIVMDVMMPVMDGLEATRLIRESTDLAVPPGVPIIAMTAHALKGDHERFLAAGMDAYLAKPVELAALHRTIFSVVPVAAGKGARSAPQAASPVPPGPPAAGRERAIELLGGDHALLARMELIYLRDTGADLQALAAAVAAGDLDSARRLAHQLKGTSATIGADHASRLARETEAAAKAGEGGLLAARAAELAGVVRRVLDGIVEAFAKTGYSRT